MTPDLIYDQLIGMGAAKKMVFSWGGNPGVGSLHRFRDAYEKGWPRPLEIEEHSHAAMANAYEAGAAGLPFAVFRGYRGAELAARQPHHQVGDLSLHRRGAGDRAGDAGSTAPSSTRRGPTAPATSCWRASSACRRRRCWPPSARW